MTRISRFSFLVLLVALLTMVLTVHAGEQALSINGDGNDVWFISGEATLVMNGFDLQSAGVARPAYIDRVSIAVDTPTPGAPVEVVIYEDGNGGSPVDAQIVGRTTVDITQSGVFTAVFPTPVMVSQQAIWVGFYLPVNFRFLADTSGPSVLTYWAWTAGGTFDLNNLGSAGVLGPSDGTAPVNINLNGKARISIEVSTSPEGASGVAVDEGLLVTQEPGPAGGDISAMASFENCPLVLYDTQDELISWRDNLNTHCNIPGEIYAPPSPQGYDRRGALYDIYFFHSRGIIALGRLTYAMTLCIQPDAADLGTGVIGIAWGAPRTWQLQTTQQYGSYICADVRRSGNLSYFVRNGLPLATPEGT